MKLHKPMGYTTDKTWKQLALYGVKRTAPEHWSYVPANRIRSRRAANARLSLNSAMDVLRRLTAERQIS